MFCDIPREYLGEHDSPLTYGKCDRIDELTKWFYEY